jgi:hypothetical protein
VPNTSSSVANRPTSLARIWRFSQQSTTPSATPTDCETNYLFKVHTEDRLPQFHISSSLYIVIPFLFALFDILSLTELLRCVLFRILSILRWHPSVSYVGYINCSPLNRLHRVGFVHRSRCAIRQTDVELDPNLFTAISNRYGCCSSVAVRCCETGCIAAAADVAVVIARELFILFANMANKHFTPLLSICF